VGYAYSRPDIISFLHRVREPFNVNSLAQVGALAAIDDQDFVQQCRTSNIAGRRQLQQGFDQLGLRHVPSEANFVMVKVGNAAECFQYLQSRGTIVRPVGGLPEYIRITVGTPEQNTRCLERLANFLQRNAS